MDVGTFKDLQRLAGSADRSINVNQSVIHRLKNSQNVKGNIFDDLCDQKREKMIKELTENNLEIIVLKEQTLANIDKFAKSDKFLEKELTRDDSVKH